MEDSNFIFSSNITDESKNIISKFLSKLKQNSSKQNYLNTFNKFCDYLKKDILVVSFNDCEKFIKHLEDRRNCNTIRTSTMNKMKKQLSSLYTYLVQNQESLHISEKMYNHFLTIQTDDVKDIYRYERVPTIPEFNDLFVYTRANDLECCIAILLAFKGFLTIEQLRTLKISDFAEDQNGNMAVKVSELDNPIKFHYNSIPDDLSSLLEGYFDYLDKKFPNSDDSPYLFSKDNIAPYTQKTLRNRLDKALKATSLPHFTYNDFRNAGAVYAVAFHADIKMVQNSLGHKTNRHIQKIDSLVVKINDAADCIGIKFVDK